MIIGRETWRCAEKHEKVGGALRYTLISALELAKSVRKAREGGSNKRKKEGARYYWQEPGRIFKVIFQGLFFRKFFRGPLGV